MCASPAHTLSSSFYAFGASLSERPLAVVVAIRAAGRGGVRARAVEGGHGLDVRPHQVVADEGARDGVALAAGFGHEAHARTGDLVGVHLLFRVHALTVADAGVIERAQPVHMHRTARVHQVAHYDAQGLNGGLGVGDADGRHAGDVLAQFVHLYGRTHGDGLRVPLLGQLLVNCFEYRHRCKNLS